MHLGMKKVQDKETGNGSASAAFNSHSQKTAVERIELIEGLKDPDPKVRIRNARISKKYDGCQAILVDALEREDDREVKIALLKALDHSGEKVAMDDCISSGFDAILKVINENISDPEMVALGLNALRWTETIENLGRTADRIVTEKNGQFPESAAIARRFWMDLYTSD